MTKGPDDLEAVRAILETLQPFETKDRERIIRWASEKLQMPSPPSTPPAGHPPDAAPSQVVRRTPSSPSAGDIKTLLAQKKPKNDRQLAAVVAYYYQFLAAPGERKQSIEKADLLEACRKGDWARPGKPAQTLVNSFNSGYLDRTGDKGKYRINTVGENLVAMVLPGSEGAPVKPGGSAQKGKKKAANKLPRRAKKPIKKR